MVHQLPGLGITPNARTLEHVLVAGINEKDDELVENTLEHMTRGGLQLSKFTAEMLLLHLATPIPGDKFLSIEQLEKLDAALSFARKSMTGKSNRRRGRTSARRKPETNARHGSGGSQLKLPSDLLHKMIDRNSGDKGQRWRSLHDLIGLLVDQHGKSARLVNDTCPSFMVR